MIPAGFFFLHPSDTDEEKFLGDVVVAHQIGDAFDQSGRSGLRSGTLQKERESSAVAESETDRLGGSGITRNEHPEDLPVSSAADIDICLQHRRGGTGLHGCDGDAAVTVAAVAHNSPHRFRSHCRSCVRRDKT